MENPKSVQAILGQFGHGGSSALASGELVAPFKRTANPARGKFALVSKNAAGQPEVEDFVAWLREEANKEPR